MDWLRERLRTTPGRLRLAAVAIALAAVIFGVVAAAAAGARRDATAGAATKDGPLVAESAGLYAALSDADASAATTFLVGGIDSPARRARYLADLRFSSGVLTTLSREVGNSGGRAAVLTLSRQLPVYAGLVESARANNRQGLPIGAAYLRQASSLMRERMLPAAGSLFQLAAHRLDGDYRTGSSGGNLAVFVIVAALMLAALVVTQVYLARRMHRTFNVPLVGATAVMLGLAAWTIAGFVSDQDALSSAKHDGSDSVEVLSAARILALRAQGDESLALAARGGDVGDLADFDAVYRALGTGRGRGLLAEAAALPQDTGVGSVIADLGRYRALGDQIARRENGGDFAGAVALAVGPRARAAPLADRLTGELSSEIVAAQNRFEHSAAQARSALGGFGISIPLMVLAAAALALLGLRERINEYR
jgi:hypothetical protein